MVMTPYGRSPRPLHMARPESTARPNTKSVLGEGKPVPTPAPRRTSRGALEGGGESPAGRRASQRRSWLDGGAYDVDLTEAIEELGPQFKELLSVILLHLVQMSPRSG